MTSWRGFSAVLLTALVPVVAEAQSIGRTSNDVRGIDDHGWPAAVKEPVSAPSVALGLDLGYVPEHVLPALSGADWDRLAAEDASASAHPVLRYGFRRELGIDPSLSGDRIDLDAGSLWVYDVVARGAIGVRLELRSLGLTAGAQVYVYSPDHPERVWGPYEGKGPFGTGEVWTPTTFGERVRIEYLLPRAAASDHFDADESATAAGIRTKPSPFTVAACQHIYRDPAASGTPEVGSCHNDVTCHPAWASVAKASAGIGYINSDALYCSGTMLTSVNGDLTPYWLTANHCISSATVAQSAEIYWLYQTSSCGGAPPSLASVPQSAVCTRLASSSTSDYSLLMVEGAVPNGLSWAGWSQSAVANNTNCTGVHHPDGSFKRISFAKKVAGAASNFIRMDWYDGPTEPGSSGSGVFRDDTQQLVGQLYGGPSSCADESYDDYGAFATTYTSIASRLAGGSDDAYDDNDTCATARAMSVATYNGLVVKRHATGDEDWYKVTVNSGQTLSVALSFTHAYGDVDLGLYGACGGPLLASSTTTGNGESLTYANTGGSATFYVRVYLASDTRNTYAMTLSFTGTGPTNDLCANATAVVNGSYTGSTASATRDGAASCGSSSTTKDVWYKFTAPRSGTLRLDTCGSSYDTVLSVHSGCPGMTSNQLSCNDDCGGSPCGAVSSCLSRSVTSGTTYRIRVSGYNGASGAFQLKVTSP